MFFCIKSPSKHLQKSPANFGAPKRSTSIASCTLIFHRHATGPTFLCLAGYRVKRARKVSRRFVPFFLGEKVKDVGTLFYFGLRRYFTWKNPYKTNISLFHGTFPDLFCCSMYFETFQIYEIQSSLSRSSRTIISPIPTWPSSVVKGYVFPCQKAAAYAGMTFLHFLTQRRE